MQNLAFSQMSGDPYCNSGSETYVANLIFI